MKNLSTLLSSLALILLALAPLPAQSPAPTPAAPAAPAAPTTAPPTTPAAPPAKPSRLPALANPAGPVPEALPVPISATDPNIRYEGRFEMTPNPAASWTASTVVLKFHGTGLNVQLADKNGKNFWQVEVDGQPTRKLPVSPGSNLYNVVSGLPEGEHTVRLVKATEAYNGPTQFLGFQINTGGKLLPPPMPTHHLEVIGDSITCGAANEGVPGVPQPSNVWENGYNSYAAITARNFGADLICISWSGHKMWPDQSMPELYDRVLPDNKNSSWDFSKFVADAVVINLSTNDFSKKMPDGQPLDLAGWSTAYKEFIARLRTHYPQAQIYCTTSPMLTKDKLEASKAAIAKIVADLNAAGDTKVMVIELPTQDPKTGIGGDHHPNIQTHQIIANLIGAALTRDLGWKPLTP